MYGTRYASLLGVFFRFEIKNVCDKRERKPVLYSFDDFFNCWFYFIFFRPNRWLKIISFDEKRRNESVIKRTELHKKNKEIRYYFGICVKCLNFCSMNATVTAISYKVIWNITCYLHSTNCESIKYVEYMSIRWSSSFHWILQLALGQNGQHIPIDTVKNVEKMQRTKTAEFFFSNIFS